MSYKVEIDNFDQKQWKLDASQFSDYSIYQTWPYQKNRAQTDGQELKRIIIRNSNDEVCLMSHIRIKNAPIIHFSIGYIQNGPLILNNNVNEADIVSLLKIMKDSLFGAGIHALRIVPNIADDDFGKVIKQHSIKAGFAENDKKKPYHTFIVDTSDSEEGIRQRLRKSFRRDLKYAEKAGLVIKEGNSNELFSVMENLYEESKGRKGFDGLEFDEFKSPQIELTESEKMKVFVAYFEDKPASALLSTELGDRSIILLAASNALGLEKGSSYLLWYHACVSAHKRGLKWCDLGGIDPDENPNVYQFKSRLGGEEIKYIGSFDLCKGVASQALMTLIEKMKG